MMNSPQDRAEARREAVKFLERMEELESSITASGAGPGWGYGHPKETGAARRASMDLTRALAKLRKYGE